MATLTVRVPPNALVYSSASGGGDVFPNSGKEILHVRNAGVGACAVTINSQRNCDQGFDHNQTVSVPAGEDRMIGYFSPNRFNNGSGNVEVTYDQVTSVTVAVMGFGG